MNLLLVLPRKWHPALSCFSTQQSDAPPKPCTLWRVATIIGIDRISYPVNIEGLQERTSRQRAALRFADYIWPELTRRTAKENFAPPFSILPASTHPGRATTWFWERQFGYSDDIDGEFIEPVYNLDVNEQIPTQEGMERHNNALKNEPLKDLGNIIVQFPWLWFPCGEIIRWIDEGESRDSWISFKPDDVDDAEALAYLSIWKHCIVEMAKIGGRAIFVFEGIPFPTMV